MRYASQMQWMKIVVTRNTCITMRASCSKFKERSDRHWNLIREEGPRKRGQCQGRSGNSPETPELNSDKTAPNFKKPGGNHPTKYDGSGSPRCNKMACRLPAQGRIFFFLQKMPNLGTYGQISKWLGAIRTNFGDQGSPGIARGRLVHNCCEL